MHDHVVPLLASTTDYLGHPDAVLPWAPAAAGYTFVRLGRGAAIHWGRPGTSQMICGQAAGGSRHHGQTSRAYGVTRITCERCIETVRRHC